MSFSRVKTIDQNIINIRQTDQDTTETKIFSAIPISIHPDLTINGNITVKGNAVFENDITLGNISVALSELSDVDTTGQKNGDLLGYNGSSWLPVSGNIDASASSIVKRDTTGNIYSQNLVIGNTKGIILKSDNNSSSLTLKAPTSFTNYEMKFPTTSGTNGALLSSDGAGSLQWITETIQGNSIISANQIQAYSGLTVSINGSSFNGNNINVIGNVIASGNLSSNIIYADNIYEKTSSAGIQINNTIRCSNPISASQMFAGRSSLNIPSFNTDEKQFPTALTEITNAENNSFYQIYISSNGRYQVAESVTNGGGSGGMFFSNDFGKTWAHPASIITTSPDATGGCALSQDGKIVLFSIAYPDADDGIYRSIDYGNTFTKLIGTPGATYWLKMAMSSDGKYVMAVGGGGTNSRYIYQSNDFGATFPTSTPLRADFGSAMSWRGVCMSSDGKYRYACNQTDIYKSSDYGVNYSIFAHGIGTTSFNEIKCSENGQHILFCSVATNIGVWYSNNYMTSITKINNNTIWAIDISGDGWLMVAGLSSGSLLYSIDHGTNWTAFGQSMSTRAIAINSTGDYIAVGSTTKLYVGNCKLNPKFDLTTTGNAIINNLVSGNCVVISDENKKLKSVVLGNNSILIGNTTGSPIALKLQGNLNNDQITIEKDIINGNLTLSTAQAIATTSSPTFQALTINGFIASKPIFSDASKKLMSGNIVGANITVSDVINGNLNISIPQAISTTSDVQFGNVKCDILKPSTRTNTLHKVDQELTTPSIPAGSMIFYFDTTGNLCVQGNNLYGQTIGPYAFHSA